MTEVLSAPLPVDGGAYFGPSRLHRSPSSPTSFYGPPPDAYARPPRSPEHHVSTGYHHHHHHPQSTSAPSSLASSPRSEPIHDHSSRSNSTTSTPPSCLSLNTKGLEADEENQDPQDDNDDGDVDDSIVFPSYDEVGAHHLADEFDPPTSPTTAKSSPPPPSPANGVAGEHPFCWPETTTTTDVMVGAEDDIAVCEEPSRHVDYLSHDWTEEDIWASWRHVVSRRRVYGNVPRLENASWRTWGKIKYRLRTVSPEKLNWLKDCDVTWLYGPLQTRHRRSMLLPSDTPSESRLSKTNSFLVKKPILKKRSMSELMLQKSLSASSLLKQAAASVQAQRNSTLPSVLVRPRAVTRSTTSDFVPSSVASRYGSGSGTSGELSTSTSGLQTPGLGERRHIHFNNEVEQCIAVEIRDGEEEEEDEDDDHAIDDDDDDDDDDDGVVMMSFSASQASHKVKISRRNTPRNSFSAESKTIAMLPSTTLKCREDTESDELSGRGRAWNTRRLSPSPSQETLRPSRPSTNLFLDDEDDEADMSWEPSDAFGGTSRDRGTTPAPGDGTSALGSLSTYGYDEAEEHRHGLRRTASGMFMPDEDEDDAVAAGLFGRVVDTVNTARDIAHVIWNVGWRR
ncbi:MAG: Translation machinery-associated protein 22 [Watsoniomyces obsoletus]|nr:MAG: Translation machinery-associated protein 22 [Watsoniomyces obsoletus]